MNGPARARVLLVIATVVLVPCLLLAGLRADAGGGMLPAVGALVAAIAIVWLAVVLFKQLGQGRA